jgi:D-alanine-D-alanine ligase
LDKKLRLGLIYGGKSGEHEVSLQTAMAVIKELDASKYEILPFYITKQGAWHTGIQLPGAIDPQSLTAQSLTAFDEVSAGLAESPVASIFGSASDLAEQAAQGTANDTAQDIAQVDGLPRLDVVFPLLHGTFGEDGTIQGLLEMADIPYVGAGVLASAVGMDKVMMKKIFAQEGLPQCLFRHFTRSQWANEREFYLMEIEVSLGYPCFVKPVNLGSSVGISKVRTREELIAAVELAFQYDRKVIVEENIDAREIEVSVLGNDNPRASVPGEVVPAAEFYDYTAKYVDGTSAMIIPADLPEPVKSQIRELALRAYEAIDGSGLARVDFFLVKDEGASTDEAVDGTAEAGQARILINEINTMPGFTPFSMYPLLWKESGLSYGELLDELIRLAIERHDAKRQIRYTFDV